MTKRGTSNGNSSGSSEDRRRRKQWLLETFRADTDAFVYRLPDGMIHVLEPWTRVVWAVEVVIDRYVPACRCYRCGKLLVFETLTVDRIIPGCQGGTYRRNNIRPACSPCNSETGGAVRSRSREPRKKRAKTR